MSAPYDPTAIDAAAAYPAPQDQARPPVPPIRAPEVRLSGPPGYGVIVVGLGWLVLAGAMLMIGGPVFMGILAAVTHV